IRLVLLGEEPQEPGRAPEPDEQHTGRVGIERPSVADSPLPVEAAQPPHDVVGRAARGLVDDDQTVAHVPRGRGGQSSAESRRATRRGASSADSKPAANRWPPPPRATATSRTSTLPSDRRLTRKVPSTSCFSTIVTSASVARRRMSIS